MSDITVDLVGCARCHGDGHPSITFKPLKHPVTYPGVEDPLATHWAMCPTSNEPILMVFRSKSWTVPGPHDWARLLVQRDSAQGPLVLERMIAYYEENDGNADDMGRLFIVTDALHALGREV